MNRIKVPFEGKGYELKYTVETIDLAAENLPYVNVYSVTVASDELKKHLGEQFSILHNPLQLSTPAFSVSSADNLEEKNLKKQIAQQIINNPTE